MFSLQLSVLTLPLHILRRLIILQPPASLQPIFFYSFIQLYLVRTAVNLWEPTE